MSRFIWQFEQTGQEWVPQGNWQKDPHKWEVRYFWPLDRIIELNISEKQLHWDKSVYKTHFDTYLIDRENPLNIKGRKDKLVYKPFISQQNDRIAYDKKVSLSTDELSQHNFLAVPVEKMSIQLIIYEKPKCVLELSKIYMLNQEFSSLCIESRCVRLLDNLHDHLKLPGKACSYIEFLCEQLTRLDN